MIFWPMKCMSVVNLEGWMQEVFAGVTSWSRQADLEALRHLKKGGPFSLKQIFPWFCLWYPLPQWVLWFFYILTWEAEVTVWYRLWTKCEHGGLDLLRRAVWVKLVSSIFSFSHCVPYRVAQVSYFQNLFFLFLSLFMFQSFLQKT